MRARPPVAGETISEIMKKNFVIRVAVGALALAGICFVMRPKPETQVEELATSRPAIERREIDGQPAALRDRPVSGHLTASVDAVAIVEPAAVSPMPIAQLTDECDVFLSKFSSQLTDDPATEDLLRNRLWLALDQLNNPLVMSLGLTANETAAVKNMIIDNLVAAAEQARAKSGADPDAIMAEMDAALVAQQDEFESGIAAFLGHDRFAIYIAGREDYAQFNRIKFLNSSEPLTDDQTRQIVAVLLDERQRVNSAAAELWAHEGTTPQSAPSDQWLQIRRLIGRRVYDRLQTLLSADRLAAFAEFRLQPPLFSQGLAAGE